MHRWLVKMTGRSCEDGKQEERGETGTGKREVYVDEYIEK